MRLLLLAAALMAAPAVAAQGPQARFDAVAEAARATMLTDPRATVEGGHLAEPLATALPDPRARVKAQATALWLQAEGLYRLEDPGAAAPLIERAATLAERAARGSQLQAEVMLTRGSIHSRQVRVAEALSDFQEAHRLFRANGDQRHEAIALICIANLYFEAKDYESALRYLAQALDAYRADPGLAYAIHNTRGLVLQDQGRFAAADAAFRQALRNARLLKSGALEAMFLRNIARNQLLAGQVAEAERTIAAARPASMAADGDRAQFNALAAQAAVQRGRLLQAGQLLEQVFAGVDLTHTDSRYRYAHLTAVAAYRGLGQPAKALAHLSALKRLDDEATKLATETGSALLAARFYRANQDTKIARLRDAERLTAARAALQRAKTERTLLLMGGGAAALIMVLLGIGLVTIRRSRDQVRAANADLAVTNGALGKALAAKTEFLATTSHEIRTPLNGILGMTQVMLADTQLAAPTRDRLTVVHGAGLTMRALVDDILDVAKMETGNLGLEAAPFAPADCIREATLMWGEQARAKGLVFDVDMTRCPPRLEGDAARVRQIVFNLLSNALKFTATGAIRLVADADAAGELRIAVTDTGIGIAADKQEAVFESFRQADTSTTRQFGGTGLGLSICRSLARAMGGEITLASVEGEGSTFTATLPLPVAAPAELAAEASAGPGLLIVDRNPIARAMFRTLLAPHAGRVEVAGTAAEAVALLAAGGLGHLLIDDSTARADGDVAAFLADVLGAAGAAQSTLLAPAGEGDEHAALLALGLTRIVIKPIAGAALAASMFPSVSDEIRHAPLVSQAA